MNSTQFDIVLPVHINRNFQIPMTVKCINLLREHTPSANLIIVETEQLFEDMADEHICSGDPLTFAKKVNIGLRQSKADHVIIASNDIYVSDGYAEAMLKCFEHDKCGVATVLSEQFHEKTRDLIEEGFFGGLWMVSRECLNKVGLLDETFINCFEDSDYWVRVKLAGMKILINRSVQIHHVQSQTVMHDESHANNYCFGRKIFKEKHKDCGLELYERLK